MSGLTSEEVLDEHPEWSRKYAQHIFAKHDCGDGWAEFVKEHGVKEVYDGADVLAFLGY